MPPVRRLVGLISLVVATATACGPKRIAEPAQPSSPETLVILLPDDGSSSTGRAQVTNQFGSTELSAERAAVTARADRRPEAIGPMKESEVKRLFGNVLSALPSAPQRYTLYFKFESDELTPASRALLRDIVGAVRQRPVPDVVVIGHTDTMGTPTRNFQLGLKRARTVRDLLVKTGLEASSMDVTSHGETDLLIRTPDATPEPRNRRVEIAVR